jgi:alkylated DNA repair dioxygenase AlkB
MMQANRELKNLTGVDSTCNLTDEQLAQCLSGARSRRTTQAVTERLSPASSPKKPLSIRKRKAPAPEHKPEAAAGEAKLGGENNSTGPQPPVSVDDAAISSSPSLSPPATAGNGDALGDAQDLTPSLSPSPATARSPVVDNDTKFTPSKKRQKMIKRKPRKQRTPKALSTSPPQLPSPTSGHSHLTIETSAPSPPPSQSSTDAGHPSSISCEELQLAAGLDTTKFQELEEKSNKLMQLAKQEPKPAPEGKPLVWSETRQILCEALPYYRAHHGAGYARDGIAYSFMFDTGASERDYMDANVVISRAGGGMERDEKSGAMVQTKDSKETSIVKAVRNGVKIKRPVCLITGDRNSTAQFAVPYRYCVLDWFKPTQVWAEKAGGQRIIRYRFEILDSTKASWWKAKGVEEPVQLGEFSPPFIHRCSSCQQESQQIYLNGWMCTVYDCKALWEFVDGSKPDEAKLVYDPRFLKQKTNWPQMSAPQSTKPNPWLLDNTDGRFDHGIVWQATKAIVCPNCGKCGARDRWMQWECNNCGTYHDLPRSVVTPNHLHDWYNPLSAGFGFAKDECDDSIRFAVRFIGNYRVNIFEIPGIDGFVAHMIANKTVNEEKNGPDDMFLELQKVDIGLKRARMKSGVEGLTNQFTKNFGMPYKFIAAPDSSSLDDAPKAIQASRARLNWSARTLLDDQFDKQFNEVLALAYMEGNKINYHDDGEPGLGPTIATLSLGYPATMTLRMKQKHYKGCTEKRFVDHPPLPGALKYAARTTACQQLALLDKKGPKYNKRLSELPWELKLNEMICPGLNGRPMRVNREADVAITLNLCHGGVVIMHGAAIQEYYEHAVVPHGKLRFALTSRYIDREALEPKDRPEYEVNDEKEPYDGFNLPAPAQ